MQLIPRTPTHLPPNISSLQPHIVLFFIFVNSKSPIIAHMSLGIWLSTGAQEPTTAHTLKEERMKLMASLWSAWVHGNKSTASLK